MKTVNSQRRYDGWDVIQNERPEVTSFHEDLQLVYNSNVGILKLLERTCGPMARRLTFVIPCPT